jgi:uncharacterized protein YeaO (DUF488 family)
MKIYTSYFSNGKRLSAANVVMVGVALFPPKWFYGTSLKQVAPKYSILKDTIFTKERYTQRYRNEVLSHVDPYWVIEVLERISGGRDVALCCFEKPGDFCHRHILAQWLMENTGVEVTEFGAYDNKEPEHPQPKQISLFD